jgi:hypothetical protein
MGGTGVYEQLLGFRVSVHKLKFSFGFACLQTKVMYALSFCVYKLQLGFGSVYIHQSYDLGL